jgi:hypothetical protein
MKPRRVFFTIALLSVSFHTPAWGTVRTVRQDGSGDFTTIGAAVAASVANDVVEVGPGTYPEKVDVYFTLTFISTDGAAATVVDGQDIHYPLWFRGGTGHVVDGFTFRNGYHASGGGAIRCMGGATLTIRNCVIEDNVSDYDGGGFFTRDPGAFIDAYDCNIRRNHAARNAGAGIAILGSRINYTRCLFFENTCGELSGAVTADRSSMDVTGCLFAGNISPTVAAVYYHLSDGNVIGNTFSANRSGVHGSVLIQSSSGTNVARNIMAGDLEGAGLVYLFSSDPHSCNVYWNNEGGSIVGGSLQPDEVEADPVFCDEFEGEYTISIHSPAAPANSPCGQLIGAFPTDCDIEAPPPPPPPVVEPVILGIEDVPNDQGRQVRIRWERADYDAPDEPYVITGYAVYRFQGDFVRARRPVTATGRGRGAAIDGWDFIATIPARGDEIYQFVAPTLCDSKPIGEYCPSVFFVSAMTPDPLTFFDSAPDTGTSYDNLPPSAPATLTVSYTNAGARLVWEDSRDEDVVKYFVYRAANGQTASDASLAQETTGLEWTDPVGTPSTRYYVAAVDDADNVGPMVASQQSTDSGVVPGEFFLAQNAPNPFNPSTTIGFGLPEGSDGTVTLEIFDVAGRLVRTLLRETRAAGTWRVSWDGTTDAGSRASSGVYFYRLQTPTFEQTRRMTLVE